MISEFATSQVLPRALTFGREGPEGCFESGILPFASIEPMDPNKEPEGRLPFSVLGGDIEPTDPNNEGALGVASGSAPGMVNELAKVVPLSVLTGGTEPIDPNNEGPLGGAPAVWQSPREGGMSYPLRLASLFLRMLTAAEREMRKS